MDLNPAAIVVSAVGVQVMSLVYYLAFTKQLAQLSPAYADPEDTSPPPGKLIVELIRNLVLATVVAGLAGLIDATDVADGLRLGLGLWVGFPIVLWTGAVLWEKVPLKLATIHAGDWLLKLLVISVVVSAWR
jgi:Protein of unknown function (DUF1761)